MECLPEHFVHGLPPEGLNILDYQEVKECMMSIVSMVCSDKSLLKNGPISMPESVVQNNEAISIAKLKTSKKRTLTTSSSKTLHPELILKEKVCKPFWNTSSLVWSQRLWLPTEIDSQELDATCWNLSSKKLALNSWFKVEMKMTNMTLHQTLLQSPPCLLPRITDVVQLKIKKEEEKKKEKAENEKEKREEKKAKLNLPKKAIRPKKVYQNPVRARRILIYPDNEQKQGLLQWFGSVRFCYNHLVASEQKAGVGGNNLADLRKKVKDAHTNNPWLNDIAGEIKDVAVCDMDKARKAHFAKLAKQKEKDHFAKHDAKFKFRSKKDPQQSFEVRPRDMVRKTGKFAFLSLDKLKSAEPLPSTVDCAVRFIRDRLGRFYLSVPRQVVKKDENQCPVTPDAIVSLDPGVRTFQTTYDVSGLSTEWGKGDMNLIFILCQKMDKCQSEWKEKKGRKRRATKKVWYRMIDKIKNKVNEIHRKLAVWLCENYKVILIPKFESSKMVKRGTRKINSMTARNMLTWSHYRFREMLKNKAELYPWVNVVETEEPYTSKTCGKCGEINQKLGGNKVFQCNKCNYVADRDINGTRNILLRYLSLYCEVSA
jgi:putative transposase